MMKIQRFRKVDIESTGDTDKQHEDSYGKKGKGKQTKRQKLLPIQLPVSSFILSYNRIKTVEKQTVVFENMIAF